MDWVSEVTSRFSDSSDFQNSMVHIAGETFTLCFLDSLVDSHYIQDHILERLRQDCVEVPFSPISTVEEALSEILNGNLLIVRDCDQQAFLAIGSGLEERSIQETENESALRGPRDSFVESLRTNISLIRRRYPDPEVKVTIQELGRRTNTKVAMLYVEGIVNPNILDEVRTRLSTVDLDEVLDCGTIEQWIEDSWYSPFPQAQYTERPSNVLFAMLEGRIAIMVDGSSAVLIVPVTFSMLFQSPDDYYERWMIGTAIRIIRVAGAVIALTLPSLYIALISYHPGMIPTQLALSISAGRSEVPFPAFLEALFMEATLEMLREAGLRLPKVMGQTIGIVGGLVIGQSAVEAGIVSPVLVIVVAITAISSFLVPAYNGAIALRLLRFPLMILSGSLGMFGLLLGLMAILAHLVSLKSFGINYFAPITPYRFSDWKDLLVRAPLIYMKNRPEILHPLDQKRMNTQKRKKGW
ncbi:spore germination protein [Brevibacillus nitrificans]|uniref:Spore germination protein n=1 Tax=Brevibacillus nitrificans TaxID=651560 RepID=A0A3M8DET1_9BACL|nr:spore germination protein [Brevibacillus nitrificans]RNB86612.1 spore germination protein [Brevibacillus nitrificans]